MVQDRLGCTGFQNKGEPGIKFLHLFPLKKPPTVYPGCGKDSIRYRLNGQAGIIELHQHPISCRDPLEIATSFNLVLPNFFGKSGEQHSLGIVKGSHRLDIARVYSLKPLV